MFEELHLILPQEPSAGPMQMALDEVLLRSVTKPTIRIYWWDEPCVTFGYFQRIAEVRKAFPKLPAVRRWTGGGMVEHGKDLTFSLMIPKGDATAFMSPVIFYKELHGRIARWLSGVFSEGVRLAVEEDLRVGASCFTAPAGDDVLLKGRKILGGAQRRSAGALLYQGSLQGLDCLAPSLWEKLAPLELAGALSPRISLQSLDSLQWKKAVEISEDRYGSVFWNEKR